MHHKVKVIEGTVFITVRHHQYEQFEKEDKIPRSRQERIFKNGRLRLYTFCNVKSCEFEDDAPKVANFHHEYSHYGGFECNCGRRWFSNGGYEIHCTAGFCKMATTECFNLDKNRKMVLVKGQARACVVAMPLINGKGDRVNWLMATTCHPLHAAYDRIRLAHLERHKDKNLKGCTSLMDLMFDRRDPYVPLPEESFKIGIPCGTIEIAEYQKFWLRKHLNTPGNHCSNNDVYFNSHAKKLIEALDPVHEKLDNNNLLALEVLRGGPNANRQIRNGKISRRASPYDVPSRQKSRGSTMSSFNLNYTSTTTRIGIAGESSYSRSAGDIEYLLTLLGI